MRQHHPLKGVMAERMATLARENLMTTDKSPEEPNIEQDVASGGFRNAIGAAVLGRIDTLIGGLQGLRNRLSVAIGAAIPHELPRLRLDRPPDGLAREVLHLDEPLAVRFQFPDCIDSIRKFIMKFVYSVGHERGILSLVRRVLTLPKTNYFAPNQLGRFQPSKPRKVTWSPNGTRSRSNSLTGEVASRLPMARPQNSMISSDNPRWCLMVRP